MKGKKENFDLIKMKQKKKNYVISLVVYMI